MFIPWLLQLLSNSSFLILKTSPQGGNFPRPLTQAEEDHFLALTAEGDIEARNKLIEHNLRLVSHIVKKYYSARDDYDDLVSIGTIGLIKAVCTFRPAKGARLATYAARCIENAIPSQMRLWFQTRTSSAEKNPNGVFWHRFPRTFTSFVPPWMVM